MGGIFKDSCWESTKDNWGDWHWQMSQRGTAWAHVTAACPDWRDNQNVHQRYPMSATPYYLSLVRTLSASDPILRQVLPIQEEITAQTGGSADPFGEVAHCHVPRLVHRYRDRALFVTTSDCGSHCRHCMRKRNWCEYPGAPEDSVLSAAVGYVQSHPEIREILISGGDPLTLSDDALERVLRAFAAIDHVEVLRIGSRLPAVLPMRLTPALAEMLGRIPKTIWLASHFNHPWELTEEAARGIETVLKAGIPVVNQSVLLKGVNDDVETLQALFTGLLKIKVKPYYLFHGDPIEGTMHFRTGVERGLELMAQLRGHVSGLAIPAFSFDLPEAGGKIRLEPGMPLTRDAEGRLVFQSFENREIPYC